MKLVLTFVLSLIPATVALAQWQAVGPNAIPQSSGPTGCGKLQAFAVDFADPQIMYAGGGIGPGNSGPSAESGVFKTTDGGNTWVSVDSGITDPMVDALWIDQANPDTVLAGTWFQGIFRTTNSGSSWVLQGKLGATTAFVQRGDSLYAAVSGGVAISTDDGSTWITIKSTSSPVRAIAVSGSALYAGLDDGDILFQASPTSAWQTVLSEPNHTMWSLACDPTSLQVVYAIEWDNYQPSLYVSTNSGTNWTSLSPPGYNNAAQVVTVDNSGRVYAGFDGSLYVSSDKGGTWTAVPGEHWDTRFLLALPGQPGKLVVGSDQGMYLTSDGGSSWVGLNDHINSSLINSVAINGSSILTTVQDYSPMASFDSGSSWEQFWGGAPPYGENGVTLFNPGNPSYAYEYTTSGFQCSTDGGTTFKSVSGIQWTFAGQNNMIAVDRLNPSTAYAISNDGIHRSSDWGVTWSKLSWSFTNPSLILVSPSDSRTIFVGTQGPALYVTHDGGSTWTQSNLNLTGASGYPIALDIDPANSNIVLIGMTWAPNGNGGGIRISIDGGVTFGTDDAGLDSSYGGTGAGWASAIQFNPDANTEQVALATQTGIYISLPGGPWTNITGNVVPKWFTDLAWSTNYLYASTYGEGVLRRLISSLPTDLSLPVQATDFVAKASAGSVTLSWRTQSEVDNAGFNVLRRGPADKGWADTTAFELIASYSNDDALKGMGTSTIGRSYSFTDTRVQSGKTYQYRIQSVSMEGTVKDLTTLSVTIDIPDAYALYQNFPNPFNPTTTISFDLKENSAVKLSIFNVLGARVQEFDLGRMSAGTYSQNVDMSHLASGVYFYRIEALGNDAERFTAMKKMMLIK